MKKERKAIFNYLSEQFIGRFTGFIIGLWASSLVSQFFTIRSIHNLWGLTAEKTVVDGVFLHRPPEARPMFPFKHHVSIRYRISSILHCQIKRLE